MVSKRVTQKEMRETIKAREEAAKVTTPDPVVSAGEVQEVMGTMSSPTVEIADVSAEPKHVLMDFEKIAAEVAGNPTVLTVPLLIAHTEGMLTQKPHGPDGIFRTQDFDVLSKYAVDVYHTAQVYGRASMVANWKAGEALNHVYAWFKDRKEGVKQNGGRLYNETLTWSSWLKKHDIPRNTAGKYRDLASNYSLRDIQDMHMLDITEVDNIAILLEPFVGAHTSLRATRAMQLKLKDKTEINIVEGTCFYIDSIGKKSLSVTISTGLHKGKKVSIYAPRIPDLMHIDSCDVKEPVQEPDTSVKPTPPPAPSGTGEPTPPPAPSGSGEPTPPPAPSGTGEPTPPPAPSGTGEPTPPPAPSGTGEPTPPPAPSGTGEPTPPPAPSGTGVRYKVTLEIILDLDVAMDADEVKEYVYEVLENSPFEEVAVKSIEKLEDTPSQPID